MCIVIPFLFVLTQKNPVVFGSNTVIFGSTTVIFGTNGISLLESQYKDWTNGNIRK